MRVRVHRLLIRLGVTIVGLCVFIQAPSYGFSSCSECLTQVAVNLQQKQLPEAEQALAECLAQAQLNNDDTAVMDCEYLLGLIRRDQGRYVEAEAKIRKALAYFEKLPDQNVKASLMHHSLAIILQKQNLFDMAFDEYERAMAIEEKGKSPPDDSIARKWLNLYEILYAPDCGDYKRGLTASQKAFDYGKASPDESLAYSVTNGLGIAFFKLGKYDDAERCYQVALAMAHKATATKRDKRLPQILQNLAKVYAAQGKTAVAEEHFLQAVAADERAEGLQSLNYAWDADSFGNFLLEQGNIQRAKQLIEAAAVIRAKKNPRAMANAISLNSLSLLYQAEGKLEDAENTARESLKLRQELCSKTSPDYAIALNTMARVLQFEKKFSESEKFASEALTINKTRLGALHPQTQLSEKLMQNVKKQK